MNRSRIISVCVKTFRINFRLFLPRSLQWSNSRWHWRWGDLMTYHNSRTPVGCTCQVQNTGLLQMYLATTQSLDSLHKVTRKLNQENSMDGM